MPGDKYLKNNAGTPTEIAAVQTSAGAGNAGNIPALDSTGRLDTSMMPSGVAADTAVIVASEALSAGDFVNVWSNAGAFNVRKADASVSGKEAHGFVLSAVLISGNATVYSAGPNTQVTGATPGTRYLSASTPGGSTATAPSGTGQVAQRLGVATSATSINFEWQTPIQLA